MKTLIYAFLGMFIAAAIGFSADAYAMNKYKGFQAQMEATKGTTAAPSHAWKHLSRYARDKAQQQGGQGTFLPTVQKEQLPKNFRNHY